MLEELFKQIQHCPLCFGDHWTKEMLELLGQKFDWFQPLPKHCQQRALTCNRACKRRQHVTSNNGWSCWPTMLQHQRMFMLSGSNCILQVLVFKKKARSNCRHGLPDRKEIWKCWFLKMWKDRTPLRKRSHLVPGRGVQVRYSLGTNVNTPFFTRECGHRDLVLGHTHRLVTCRSWAIHCFALPGMLKFQSEQLCYRYISVGTQGVNRKPFCAGTQALMLGHQVWTASKQTFFRLVTLIILIIIYHRHRYHHRNRCRRHHRYYHYYLQE